MRGTILLFASVALGLSLASRAVLAVSRKALDPSFLRDGRVVTALSDPETPRASRGVDVAAHLYGKTAAGGHAEVGSSEAVSRNTHCWTLTANSQLTPARYRDVYTCRAALMERGLRRKGRV